jgi:2-polyprenyl-6-methoxyphenol hydroxylase-like FAD-dependent oxidoreductase
VARTLRTAVIGGGIGGLTAARALCARGFEVVVHEATPALREIGAGVALGPNAMKALRSLGLEHRVREIAGGSERMLLRNGRNGRVISAMSRAETAARYGAAGCTVHRADLLDVLAAAVPPEIVRLGARCVSVATDGAVASARFADGSEIEADVVIGADGIHSVVRGSLFGEDAPRFTGKICYRSVIAVGDVPGGVEVDDATWLGPHGTIVVYRVRRGELINVVCHYDDAGYVHESWIEQCDREEVLERYRDWHESLRRMFSASELWYKWALYDRDPIPRWTSGRATVLGDAAHPMLPYLGQGACQAIEDGCVLAAALASMPEDPVGGLARYERSRRPRASEVVLTSRARGASNHLTSPFAAWRRDALIALRRRLRSDPEGRGASWIADYDAGSPDALAA